MSLYVDDLLVTENNIALIEEFKEEMMKVFEMTDLGEMTYFLGMEIKQTQNEVFVCQKKYMKEILKRFRIENAKIVAQSSAEEEFTVVTTTVNQALWIKKIFCHLGLEMKENTEIFVDNQAVIVIFHNPVFLESQELHVKLYFLREVQKNGLMNLVYCRTQEQLVDIFTKALSTSKFEFLRNKLRVRSS
ncbi:uncharacterized protein LOC107874096 [Capsicum annuum]|uniref:uncharacterized protein LOC107874096 n=1 Tax=Capsicum annuum TaxID=4072 RepID=UPI0007BF73F4|nr:uncharacterized protein LOC107874096 [Capsicum annuum]